MTQTKILVVEDEAIIAQNLQNMLEALGYEVPTPCSSGEAAIVLTAKLQPDLVLMDIGLKGEIDGIQAAEHIREQLNIPVVYITGHSEETLFQEARITRPYGYLIKPIDGRELRPNIEMALDRHKAEQALRESEERFRSTFEQAAVGITHVLPDGRLIRHNQRFCDIVGYTRDELLAVTFQEITHPDDLDTDLEYMQQVLAGEIQTFSMEKRYIRKDSSIVWVNLTVSLVRESSGEPKYFIGIIEDISERVLAVEALQKSEEKYRTLFEAESDTIFLVDEETFDILDANDAAVAMYGYSREELMQLKAMDLSAEPEKTIKAIVLDGTTHIPLRYHKKKDGTVFPVEITASDYELDGRSINISTIRDITERVQAEEALREGEERYRSLFDSVPIGLNLTTPEGQILDVNPATVSILGYPDRESLLAVNSIDLYKDSEDRKYWQGKIENEEFVREFEVQMRRQDGQIIWVESNLHAFRDASGQVQYYEGSTKDITERKRAEEALRESEERFKTLVERNPHGIQLTDPTGIITYVNPAYQEMLGYTKEELLGKHIVDLLEPASKRPELREYLSLLVKEKPEPTTYFQQNRRKDGEVIEQAVDWNYSRDGEGNVVGFISVITEITERVRAEERIKASLREKEVLLKEIHHRVKNNMQVINSLLSLQATRTQDERVRELLKDSQSRVRSMALVHERLYQSPDLAQVDFAGYVQELSRELFYMYNVNPAAIKIHIDVEGVSLGIDQAVPCGLIINELISNSLKHAFPEDRSGELRLQMRKDSEETILVVSDNGVSLPQDLDWRNTTFLGLQLVSTLTEQLEGEIELDRSGGTTFKITF